MATVSMPRLFPGCRSGGPACSWYPARSPGTPVCRAPPECRTTGPIDGGLLDPLYDILEERGIRVFLVNARDTKNMPGRQSDIQERAVALRPSPCNRRGSIGPVVRHSGGARHTGVPGERAGYQEHAGPPERHPGMPMVVEAAGLWVAEELVPALRRRSV